MNEIIQNVLAYMNAKALEHIDDPEKGLRELILSHRVVAIGIVTKPSIEQLQALKIYPGLDHLNLVQLRKGLETGSLRLEAVPEGLANVWKEDLTTAGVNCTVAPMSEGQLAAKLQEAGLAPLIG